MINIPDKVKSYCENCLAKKHSKRRFDCSIENVIKGIRNKECYQVIFHFPGRDDEIIANCSCRDEASAYGDYLSNAMYVGWR